MTLADSYYLWLMPQSETREHYDGIIRKLSVEYGTSVFEPHVTLVSGLSGAENELLEKVGRFASDKKALTVKTDGIDYEHGFFKALFVKIYNNPEIDRLNDQARTALSPAGQGPYHPHLSILYGELTQDDKDAIITDLQLPETTLTLAKLKLVKGSKNVDQWRTIGEWPLGVKITN